MKVIIICLISPFYSMSVYGRKELLGG